MEITSFYRDTWVEVDLDCIYNNVQSMKKHVPNDSEVIAVVKANGYGHGDIQVAKTALEAGASYLAVALLDEALSLRKQGIEAPILVLGAVRPEYINIAAANKITLTITSFDWLLQAKHYYKQHQPICLHLKIDTGMGRLGIKEKDEALKIIEAIDQNEGFLLEGIFTHFATADELTSDYFDMQYKVFQEMLHWFPNKPKMIHCANSATGLRFPEKIFNAVRFGISMYGLSPSMEMKKVLPFALQEAFSLHSRIVHVKQIKQGEKISYGATFTATEESWIGTVPIGYADGWIRKHQNSFVLVDGQRCPIIGRVCMDQLMVKLPYEVQVGEKVTLIGKQKDERISIDEVAKRLETINYEITCTISSRVPRIFLKNKSIIEVSNPVLI